MAGAYEIPEQRCHARSTSMPTGSHPVVRRVEEELTKLKACMSSLSTLPSFGCTVSTQIAVRGLGDLYSSIEELLWLPSSQVSCSLPQQKKWVELELDASLRLLDLCNAVKDNLAATREHTQDLQLLLRRKGDMISESNIHAYVCSAKKANKDINKSLKALKLMDCKCGSYLAVVEDPELRMVVMSLKEAREVTISLLQSVMSFMSKPCPKQSRWSSVSKALHKRRVVSEGHDYKSVISFSCKEYTHDQLASLKDKVQRLESEVELLFRRLIQNRVSLLNILSL
ncbi:hypothetical protein J5N97_023819 [Dioscorea zingiberensis]|uniref:Uncharacterized protein n=1 Tax=Dioscorea zingiberensis TaxID=325984 RepID=A0A9D5H8C5_9LILI|nr:hypothetical protein J5N97_023819 [Dioscorea zingiberensis]